MLRDIWSHSRDTGLFLAADLERSPGCQLWIMRDIPLMMSQAEGMLQGCGGGGSEK